MRLRFEAPADATPEELWSLVARPDRWREWAPHLRGANGLGWPEVEPGARGTVSLLGAVGVPALITDVEPGRSWSWRVGPLDLDHIVEPSGTGARSILVIRPASAAGAALASAYAPAVWALNRNLARVAEASSAGRVAA